MNKIESALQEYGVSIDELAAAGGTAAKVKATDTYGMVVEALGESTAQALIDAIANKVMNELINKNKIVNNLLATDASTVLAGTQGAALDKRLVATENAVTKLNSDIKIKFYGKVTDLSVIKTLCQQEYECWVGYIDWKNTEILPSTGGTMLWFAFDWIVCGLCYGKMFYLNMDTLTWS